MVRRFSTRPEWVVGCCQLGSVVLFSRDDVFFSSFSFFQHSRILPLIHVYTYDAWIDRLGWGGLGLLSWRIEIPPFSCVWGQRLFSSNSVCNFFFNLANFDFGSKVRLLANFSCCGLLRCGPTSLIWPFFFLFWPVASFSTSFGQY